MAYAQHPPPPGGFRWSPSDSGWLLPVCFCFRFCSTVSHVLFVLKSCDPFCLSQVVCCISPAFLLMFPCSAFPCLCLLCSWSVHSLWFGLFSFFTFFVVTEEFALFSFSLNKACFQFSFDLLSAPGSNIRNSTHNYLASEGLLTIACAPSLNPVQYHGND